VKLALIAFYFTSSPLERNPMVLDFFRKSRCTPPPARAPRRPGLEVLECRDVPTIALTNGIITITGTSGDDNVTVQFANPRSANPYNAQVLVTRTSGEQRESQTIAVWVTEGSPNGLLLHIKEVTGISFHGMAGDDVFQNLTNIPAVAYGDAGSDTFHAGYGGDHLYGGSAGNNHLFGGAGKDLLVGGGNNNVLVSIGGGVDHLSSSSPTDNLWYDSSDLLDNVTPAQQAGGYVHRVSAFYSYSYNGGSGQTPVSLQLRGQNLADPLPGLPDVQETNFKNLPLFGRQGPQITDIEQGDIGDCYFLSELGAMVKIDPGSIGRLVVDLGDGTYAVNFHNALGKSVFVRVDADLWTYPDGSLVFAGLGQQDSLWVPIVEKAWAFYRDQLGNYNSIANGNAPGVPLAAALNVINVPVNPTASYTDGVAYLTAIQTALSQGLAVTFGAPVNFNDNTPETMTTHRRGQHIYVVESVLTDTQGTPTGIQLYNPWGFEVTVHNPALIYFCSLGYGAFKV
jgi:hypothetical protein